MESYNEEARSGHVVDNYNWAKQRPDPGLSTHTAVTKKYIIKLCTWAEVPGYLRVQSPQNSN